MCMSSGAGDVEGLLCVCVCVWVVRGGECQDGSVWTHLVRDKLGVMVCAHSVYVARKRGTERSYKAISYATHHLHEVQVFSVCCFVKWATDA